MPAYKYGILQATLEWIAISLKNVLRRLNQVLFSVVKVTRDPRFDDLSGEYNEKFFRKAYSFLGDIKQREKQVGCHT